MTQTDIELPDEGDNIIRTNDLDAFLNPNGVAHELYIKLKKNSDKQGQIEAVSGVSETFGAILERAVRVACHLKKLGVTPKDIITPCTTNHLNTSVVLYAIFFTGAKPACIDPGAPEEVQTTQLQLVEPKLIFATPEVVVRLEKIIEKLSLSAKIVVFGQTDKHVSFEEFLVPLPKEETDFTVYTTNNYFDTALIVFSSGSTGSPKGVCITHYQVLAIAPSVTEHDIEVTVHMSYALLAWISGIKLAIFSSMLGHTNLICSNFEVEKTWKYLEKYQVSCAYLAPQDFLSLVKSRKPDNLELPALKVISPVGGIISSAILTEARRMFSKTLVVSMYGQTELCTLGLLPEFTPAGIAQCLSKPTMLGTPMKGFTYKIVDAETEEILGANKPGELRMKTKLVMNGYYKADSRDCFDSQGFLKTGDIMYYDEDHCFFFVERLKEMLRYRSYAVAPTELEAILLQHPSVKFAVVLGIPTDEGDIIMAVVVKSDDNVTSEELENLVASKVDDRKRLRGGVKFLAASEIPFTATGKVNRKNLLQYIMEKN